MYLLVSLLYSKDFCIFLRILTDFETHPDSCSVVNRGSFRGSNGDCVWNWPVRSVLCRG